MRRDLIAGWAMLGVSLLILIMAGALGSAEGVKAGAFILPFALGWLFGRL